MHKVNLKSTRTNNLIVQVLFLVKQQQRRRRMTMLWLGDNRKISFINERAPSACLVLIAFVRFSINFHRQKSFFFIFLQNWFPENRRRELRIAKDANCFVQMFASHCGVQIKIPTSTWVASGEFLFTGRVWNWLNWVFKKLYCKIFQMPVEQVFFLYVWFS